MTTRAFLTEWAVRHHVSLQALTELVDVLAHADATPEPADPAHLASEARVQSLVRLEAPKHGYWLSRNNVGALRDSAGRFIRFGLANESKQQNALVKSGDLIGFRRRVIIPSDVGSVIAQFTSRECKKEGWELSPNDPHSQAQAAWRDFVNTNGGDAAFVSGPGSFKQQLLPLAAPKVTK